MTYDDFQSACRFLGACGLLMVVAYVVSRIVKGDRHG